MYPFQVPCSPNTISYADCTHHLLPGQESHIPEPGCLSACSFLFCGRTRGPLSRPVVMVSPQEASGARPELHSRWPGSETVARLKSSWQGLHVYWVLRNLSWVIRCRGQWPWNSSLRWGCINASSGLEHRQGRGSEIWLRSPQGSAPWSLSVSLSLTLFFLSSFALIGAGFQALPFWILVSPMWCGCKWAALVLKANGEGPHWHLLSLMCTIFYLMPQFALQSSQILKEWL